MNIFTVTMAPVNPPYDDGVKNIVINIARRLRKYRFFFVSSLFGRCFPGEENVTLLRSPFQRTGRHSMSPGQKAFVFAKIVLNIRKIDAIQFFITPQPYFSGVFRKFLKRSGKRSIQVLSSIHTLYEKNREEDIPRLFFGDRVVVYSDHAKRKLEEAGVANVIRIYPGIDIKRFDEAGDGSRSFAPGVFSETGSNIVYAGTYRVLEEAYSFEDLCAMAAGVIEREGDVKFIMACRVRTPEDIRLRDRFVEMTRVLGIMRNFTFLDTVEDMPALFKRCDIGIMPARSSMSGVLEIPMVLLEMAFLGKPVIYGAVSPLDELRDKKLGVMLDDGSPAAYSDEILRFLKDKKLAAETGHESKQAVIKFFNMDNMAREYEELYDVLKR